MAAQVNKSLQTLLLPDIAPALSPLPTPSKSKRDKQRVYKATINLPARERQLTLDRDAIGAMRLIAAYGLR